MDARDGQVPAPEATPQLGAAPIHPLTPDAPHEGADGRVRASVWQCGMLAYAPAPCLAQGRR